MYIAMNRFRIRPGQEETFEEVWNKRDSHLDGVPGFVSFHLLRGPKGDDATLFATHTVWASKAAFEAWTQSEAFVKAHAAAREGGSSLKDVYLGPPQLETFDAILEKLPGK